MSAVCCCDKNLGQRINIEFCVNVGTSASETSAILTLACGGYAMKKLSVTEWRRRYKEEEEMPKRTQVDSHTHKTTGADVDRVRTWCS
jgi:hypothetical protein